MRSAFQNFYFRFAAIIVAMCGFSNFAWSADEIQVYNAAIAGVGEFTIQQHLNYVGSGLKGQPFSGGLVSDKSINGTPEFALGLTDWWEVGLYLPFSIQDRTFYSDAFKVRSLFVSPKANDRSFFYGVNFEFSNETPPFSQSRFGLEIRPIVGVRNELYEFIVNPIVDTAFGKDGEASFAPAVRLARKFGPDLLGGFEYYADLGKIGGFSGIDQQKHTLFAVTDFKVADFSVNFGIGYGLTPASDRWVAKAIIGYAFPASLTPPPRSQHAASACRPSSAPAPGIYPYSCAAP